MRIRTLILVLLMLTIGFIGGYLVANNGPHGVRSVALVAPATADEASREGYLEEREGQFERWGRKLDTFRRDAERKGEAARREAQQKLDAAWIEAKENWRTLKSASQEGWSKAKAAFEESWRKLETAWNEATSDG